MSHLRFGIAYSFFKKVFESGIVRYNESNYFKHVGVLQTSGLGDQDVQVRDRNKWFGVVVEILHSGTEKYRQRRTARAHPLTRHAHYV